MIRLECNASAAGDADALALAAGEFVREAVECLFAQAHLEGERGDPLRQLAAARDPVIDDRLADDVANLEARVERGVGVLEHDLELMPVRPYLAAG